MSNGVTRAISLLSVPPCNFKTDASVARLFSEKETGISSFRTEFIGKSQHGAGIRFYWGALGYKFSQSMID